MEPRDMERLHAYLDGELHGKDRTAVEAMLAEDEGARKELEALRRTREAIRSSAPESHDIDAEWHELSAKLERPGAHERVLPFPLPIGLGAAAAVLLLGLFVWSALPGDRSAGPSQDFSASSVELVETDLEDSSTIVYIDPVSGWTVVWVEEAGPLEQPLG